mgnify:CR=1 FL=1
MNLFGTRQKQLLRFLTANAERETLDYVLQGMLEVLGEKNAPYRRGLEGLFDEPGIG